MNFLKLKLVPAGFTMRRQQINVPVLNLILTGRMEFLVNDLFSSVKNKLFRIGSVTCCVICTNTDVI
jgi:hypothetical protein